MNAIIIFFVLHWYASVIAQSFFLHRYMAHGMFRMTPFWEKFFYLFTFLAQGSSFLYPKAYAALHMEHHKHSDTEEDPHSPHFFHNVYSMMKNTALVYLEFKNGKRDSSSQSIKDLPTWPLIDRLGNSHSVRLAFCILYILFYFAFAPTPIWFVLLPFHFLMGPIHGAFVNWCGHKYGYRNHDTPDGSRNTFAWDLIFVGETFQNNHHRYPNRANFANRWYECDILYPFILILNKLNVIQLKAP